MYVRPTSTLLLSGMLTPEILAMLLLLALPLLVPRVLADHQHHTAAPDDLAFLTHGLDRRPYLHGFLAILIRTGGPAGPRRRAGEPGARLTHRVRMPLRPVDASNRFKFGVWSLESGVGSRESSPFAPRLSGLRS